jgi:hypothetical protein
MNITKLNVRYHLLIANAGGLYDPDRWATCYRRT